MDWIENDGAREETFRFIVEGEEEVDLSDPEGLKNRYNSRKALAAREQAALDKAAKLEEDIDYTDPKEIDKQPAARKEWNTNVSLRHKRLTSPYRRDVILGDLMADKKY